MNSTIDLSRLPEIPALFRLTRSLAVLDAVLSSDWEYRYYSFELAEQRGLRGRSDCLNPHGATVLAWKPRATRHTVRA